MNGIIVERDLPDAGKVLFYLDFYTERREKIKGSIFVTWSVISGPHATKIILPAHLVVVNYNKL